MKLPLANEAVIPRIAVSVRKQQSERVGSPAPQVRGQAFYQLRRNRKAPIAFAGFHGLDLTSPHALANVDYSILQIEVNSPQTANLAGPDSSLCQNAVEAFVGLAGTLNDLLDLIQRQAKRPHYPSLG